MTQAWMNGHELNPDDYEVLYDHGRLFFKVKSSSMPPTGTYPYRVVHDGLYYEGEMKVVPTWGDVARVRKPRAPKPPTSEGIS